MLAVGSKRCGDCRRSRGCRRWGRVSPDLRREGASDRPTDSPRGLRSGGVPERARRRHGAPPRRRRRRRGKTGRCGPEPQQRQHERRHQRENGCDRRNGADVGRHWRWRRRRGTIRGDRGARRRFSGVQGDSDAPETQALRARDATRRTQGPRDLLRPSEADVLGDAAAPNRCRRRNNHLRRKEQQQQQYSGELEDAPARENGGEKPSAVVHV